MWVYSESVTVWVYSESVTVWVYSESVTVWCHVWVYSVLTLVPDKQVQKFMLRNQCAAKLGLAR